MTAIKAKRNAVLDLSCFEIYYYIYYWLNELDTCMLEIANKK